MKQRCEVIILGAGAAGMMCAVTAAARGRKVTLIDHANKVGKKILMSGGGRCNFTNYSIEPENYLSINSHFCISALSRYNQWQFIEWVESAGIEYYDKGQGQLFCRHSSKDIRDLLVNQCRKLGVQIKLKTHVEAVEFDHNMFSITTSLTKYQCDSLVIATGGLSIPTMGASGFGYDVAIQFKHKIVPCVPALSPLLMDQKWLHKTAKLPGNSVMAKVTCDNQSFEDSILFTHKGLSGPAILQISSYWQPGKALYLDLVPQLDALEWLEINIKARPEIQLTTLLKTQLSQAVADYLADLIGFNAKLKQMDHALRDKVIKQLTQWQIYPIDYEGYRVAEVTKGGIDTDEISSKTFESQRQQGLYFIGEVLDVTGHLGGYNFQWAWASGHAAGSVV
ncbi:MAG: NAD(P)/FAD-dependent oxidoreductase [Enterobacterales bacterium]|nr:NAD(P)/FAD-dependent oxidoreductase [Enterobacterales bacterium]